MPYARTRRIAILLTTCLSLAAAARAEPLTIAVTPSALSLPVDVAQAQGYFTDEGVEVKVVDCNTGRRCLQQLFDGSAPLVTVTELLVMSASFDRNDHAVISTIATSNGNIRLIARKSAGITQAAQLSGKRIGVIVGTSSHYYLDAFLLFHDVDPRHIQLVPLLPENIVAAVEKGQVDALAGYSRHTGPVLKSLGTDGVMLDDPRIYTETYNLVADRRVLARRGADVGRVLRALERAEHFIADQPAQARRILLARTALDSRLVDSILPSFTYRLSLDQSLIAAMEGEARWAIREGHVAAGRKIPNFLNVVDFGPLRANVPSALPR